jgi:transposase
MSRTELKRAGILSRVTSRELRLVDAATMMGLSYRQSKRIWVRYREHGAEGLKHRGVGRPSNRRKPKQFRQRVIRLLRQKYGGEIAARFGPTLASEHLASEDGIEIHVQTLRRWMVAEGLWNRARQRRAHRKRRERKPHFGELVQMDGSFHDWFEGRGPRGCLMNMVDDATGKTLARLGAEETIWSAVGVLRAWIRQYGVPLALYTDWKNVYVQEPTPKQELRGIVPVTQFGRMCQRLGIRIVAASSPQAKGRVERNHGTHQDRLVKKLRRQGIRSYAAANAFLEQEYLPEHNRRFARVPAQAEDYHRRVSARELEEALHLETERTVGNDWVIRHEKRYFQLPRQGRRLPPAKAKVQVCEWEDGRMEIRYRDQLLSYEEIAAPAAPIPQVKIAPVRSGRRWTPAARHPWRSSWSRRPGLGVVAPPLAMVASSASP